MDTPPRGRAAAQAQLTLADAKLDLLAALDPLLILSVREPCFAAVVGHTLQNKIDTWPLLDQFNIQDRIIATLDYAFPEQLEVEDDFCCYLRDNQYDLSHCFAMTEVGTLSETGFTPDPSVQKLLAYTIPNTLHEINLMPKPMDSGHVLEKLAASVAWLRNAWQATGNPGGRIYINIVDLMDTFMADRDYALDVLELLATLPVDGLSFEDGRGSFFPFQVGAVVAAAKAVLAPGQAILFHCHSGNGMDNASVIEALLQGANGYWGGMERTSSTIGHASVGELVANLVRAGNPNMARRFSLPDLLPVSAKMYSINNNLPDAPDDWPIAGYDAYRTVLSDFTQTDRRKMDLPPQVIGGTGQFRIAPVGSDISVVQERVYEVVRVKIERDLARQMILLMRADLRQGLRIVYDEPEQLTRLYRRALLATTEPA
ncbi:hypothetical protein [Massilia sp. TSP1-1-2]|uniref:hypothetical protein n=1 Tax=Massilia sp. TSP1-1-2 TaxID=2804649 RepID=UPI003CF4AB6A